MKCLRAASRMAVSTLLGLPAALVSHAVIFGNAHAAGGNLHAASAYAAYIFALCAAFFAGAAAVRRNPCWRPHIAGITVAAAAWLALLEVRESPHATPALLCVFAVVAVSALFAVLSQTFTVALAAVAQAFQRRAVDATRQIVQHFSRLAQLYTSTCLHFALFSRPPPALS